MPRAKDLVIGTSTLVIGVADSALVVAAVARSGLSGGRRGSIDVVCVGGFAAFCFLVAAILLGRALTGRSPPPRIRPAVVGSDTERSKDRQAIGCGAFLLLLVHAFVVYRLFG